MLKHVLPISENYLGVDFGTKTLGLAVSQDGIITPLTAVASGVQMYSKIKDLTIAYQVKKAYVGLSTGPLRALQLNFVAELKRVIKLPVETVDETATTIEAQSILNANRHSRKLHRRLIDSVSAALILERVIH